jgi:prepilin peptidase CpaA
MSLLVPLQSVCLIVFVLLLLAAARQDLRSMRIADGFSVAVVATFGVWTLCGFAGDGPSLARIGLAVGCAAAVFALGALAFALGGLGGGDVKLLAASSLFAGSDLLVEFLTVTALAGGVLGLAVLAGAPIGPTATAGGTSVQTRLRGGLPYGPAIAVGGLWIAAASAMS